jgi:UDP-N-acetylmuramoyl-L-alanyl-D-glutamate--2,6-diaminopimelate ligase
MPSVAVGNNGQYVVTWSDAYDHDDLDDGDSIAPKIRGRLLDINGQNVNVGYFDYQTDIHSRDSVQISNIFCALLCVATYYKPKQEQINLLISKLGEIKPAQGRMQLVSTLKNNAQIFIDYAHTPDALKNVLSATKQISHRKIYIVFGCGGNRDKDKRPQMGKIASDLADYVIITDDNPRYEDASTIRKEILSACDLHKTIETTDRETAIYQAILILKRDDILIVAGKGHEKYQIIGNEKHPFDEEKIIKEFVESREL